MIQFTEVRTEVYDIAVERYMTDPDKPVAQELWRRGLRVYRGAVNQVGIDTGEMRSRITIGHGIDGLGHYIEVVSNDPKTIIHHEGTRAHMIVPNKHKAMKFTKNGGAVFAHSVLHPGTRPNRFLTDNLHRAV